MKEPHHSVKWNILFTSFILASSLNIFSPLQAQSVTEMKLYPGAIPGSIHSKIKEQVVFENGTIRISSVVAPTLTKFTPVKPNGTSVIICPGGGYGRLAIDHEGVEVAKAFNEQGITAFVLKYRLPNDSIMTDKKTGPLQDAQQAIWNVRKQAKEWGLDPQKIGIMGFSAGGHLASTAATHFSFFADSSLKGTISIRPDFTILIYPVISFNDSFTHQGSKNNLIGNKPTEEMTKTFSNELRVTKNSPPLFWFMREMMKWCRSKIVFVFTRLVLKIRCQ